MHAGPEPAYDSIPWQNHRVVAELKNYSMDEKPLEISILRTFSPLDGLKAENLHALARKTHLRDLDAGRVLFKEGDTDKRTFYLVAGSVELRADDRVMGVIRAGTPEARAALAPGLPRKFSARAATDLSYIMIDSDLLDVLLTWDQTGPIRSHRIARRRSRRDRRLDDHASADQGVSSHPAGQYPGDLHAHAADQLSRTRRGDQARHGGRLLLRRGRRKMHRHPRDAAQQGRHQARRARAGRQLRRRGADRRGQAQCDRDDVDATAR